MTQDLRGTGGACPDVEEISALLDGALDAERAAALDAHLATCAACARVRFRLEQASTLVQGLPREAASEDLVHRVAVAAARPERRSRFGRGAWALAAAASGLMGTLLLYRLVAVQRDMAPEAAAPAGARAAKVAVAEPPPAAPTTVTGYRAADGDVSTLGMREGALEDEAQAERDLAKDDRLANDEKRSDASSSLRSLDAIAAVGGKEEQVEEAKKPAAMQPITEADRNAVQFSTGSFSQFPDDGREAAARENAPSLVTPMGAAAGAAQEPRASPPMPAPAASPPSELARNERAKTAPADAPARSRADASGTAGQSKLGEVAQSSASARDSEAPDTYALPADAGLDRRQAPADRCEMLTALVSGGYVLFDAPGVVPPRLLTPGRLEVPARWIADAPSSAHVTVLVEADGSARGCSAIASGVLPRTKSDVERRARDLVDGWRFEPARQGEKAVAYELILEVPVAPAP